MWWTFLSTEKALGQPGTKSLSSSQRDRVLMCTLETT